MLIIQVCDFVKKLSSTGTTLSDKISVDKTAENFVRRNVLSAYFLYKRVIQILNPPLQKEMEKTYYCPIKFI